MRWILSRWSPIKSFHVICGHHSSLSLIVTFCLSFPRSTSSIVIIIIIYNIQYFTQLWSNPNFVTSLSFFDWIFTFPFQHSFSLSLSSLSLSLSIKLDILVLLLDSFSGFELWIFMALLCLLLFLLASYSASADEGECFNVLVSICFGFILL